MTGPPLAPPHQVRLHSRDLDETRDAVAKAFCPHRLSLTERGGHLDARYRAARAAGMGIHHLDYGAAVRIDADDLGDCYLVEVPLGGASQVTSGRQSVVADRTTAVVLSPDDPLAVRRAPGSPQLILNIDRAVLEAHLQRMVNGRIRQRLGFSLGMALDSPAGRTWLNLVNLLRGETENGGTLLGEPVALAHLQALLMTHLLLSQPNTYSDALHTRESAPPPKTIRRALEIIETRAAEALTVADIAAEVHVSVRVLQDGFRRHLGCSPTEQLRATRLDQARRALLEGDPATTTVTTVALRWGFLHLGRFAVEYRRRFGESPSATLRGAGSPVAPR